MPKVNKIALATVGITTVLIGARYSWVVSVLGAALILASLFWARLGLKSLVFVVASSVTVWIITGSILAAVSSKKTCIGGQSGTLCSTPHPALEIGLEIVALLCALTVLPISLAIAMHRRSQNRLPK
jgi:energy-coupling factor transporter transmembrane protein EcfT